MPRPQMEGAILLVRRHSLGHLAALVVPSAGPAQIHQHPRRSRCRLHHAGSISQRPRHDWAGLRGDPLQQCGQQQ
eukprot:scaffold488830_cov47-Prasinocladus_malaysianus.AAC.2